MNTRLINVFAFAAGAAIGSVVTWKILKTKYRQTIDEEVNKQVESVKEAYNEFCKDAYSTVKGELKELEDTINNMPEEIPENIHNIDIRQYRSLLTDEEYNDYTKAEGGAEMTKKPYVIPPEEYGEKLGYDMVSLQYYADGVLVDDAYNKYEPDEIEALVGLESLKHFGDHEDDPDVVYVRNEDRETDYEILAVEDRYEDLSDD